MAELTEADFADLKRPKGTLPPVIEHMSVEQEVHFREEEPIILAHVPSIPPSLRGVDLARVETRTDLMKDLTRVIPLNEYNLPLYIYRPDLVDIGMLLNSDKADLTEVGDMLNSAILHLDYSEGFPSINSFALWQQFPWESKEAYAAFLHYLDQPGARALHVIEAYTIELMTEYFHQNYWAFRALAFDMFKVAHHNRLRERRIMSTENLHFEESERVLKRVTQAIGQISDDDLAKVDPSSLVGMMERLTNIQRKAAGLSQAGGKDEEKGGKLQSVEVTMRKVAEVNTPSRKADDSFDMDNLLSNPEAIDAAQDLIIKVTSR